jgi:hypothetical protein
MIKWNGEKIASAGMYEGIPMDAYHGDLCVGPSISSGGLRTMWDRSPAHYFVGSYLNPDRVVLDNPAFAFGRAAHKLLIEGRDGFADEYAVRPEEWKDWRGKAAQEWRDEQLKAGLTVLTQEDLFNIAGMAKALAAHPMVKHGILDGLIERSCIWQDERTGMWLKARPDAIPSPTDLADLKTTASVSDDDIQRSITNFGYNVQAAVAMAGVEAVTKVKPESFTLVFAEKAAPWSVRVVTLMAEDIERGASIMKWATWEFAKAVRTGIWPGPDRGVADAEFIPMSGWARKVIDERLSILLPAQEYEAYEAENGEVHG